MFIYVPKVGSRLCLFFVAHEILKVRIDAYGNVKGCPIQPPELIEGNIRTMSLEEIWLSDHAFLNNRRDAGLKGYCSKCNHKKVCRAGCVCIIWK